MKLYLNLFYLLNVLFYNYVNTIKCNVGYGQRGKLRSDGYEWVSYFSLIFYYFELI